MWPSLSPTDTRVLFTLLVFAVALHRVVELFVSRRNQHWLEQRGGIEVGREHYPWMVSMHVAFLVSCPAEVWTLERVFRPALAAVMVALLAASLILRYWAISALGRRWTTRIVVVPGSSRVVTGPFRFLKHPNYLAVVTEMAALPLVHSAWLSAVVFSIANLILLGERLRVETLALDRAERSPAPGSIR